MGGVAGLTAPDGRRAGGPCRVAVLVVHGRLGRLRGLRRGGARDRRGRLRRRGGCGNRLGDGDPYDGTVVRRALALRLQGDLVRELVLARVPVGGGVDEGGALDRDGAVRGRARRGQVGLRRSVRGEQGGVGAVLQSHEVVGQRRDRDLLPGRRALGVVGEGERALRGGGGGRGNGLRVLARSRVTPASRQCQCQDRDSRRRRQPALRHACVHVPPKVLRGAVRLRGDARNGGSAGWCTPGE